MMNPHGDQHYSIATSRMRREIRRPQRFAECVDTIDFAYALVVGESGDKPLSYQEAMQRTEATY